MFLCLVYRIPVITQIHGLGLNPLTVIKTGPGFVVGDERWRICAQQSKCRTSLIIDYLHNAYFYFILCYIFSSFGFQSFINP